MSQAGVIGNSGGGATSLTITGNTGGPISPDGFNWNIVTANTNIVFAGLGSTLTLDFALDTNIVLGSAASGMVGADGNTGVGVQSLSALTSGSSNVAVGQLSLNSLTTGSSNTAIGQGSMFSSGGNIEGNTGVGWHSLLGTTGFFNTALGHSSMGGGTVAGQQNVGIGAFCCPNLSTGNDNVIIGFQAASGVTTGSQNVYLGSLVGYNIDTGSANTCAGYDCFNNSVGGGAASNNSFFGNTSGTNYLNGTFNSGFGDSSLGEGDGNYNSAFGYNAGIAYTSTESSNICIANDGVMSENNTLRIGQTGSGNRQINRAFMGGTYGLTVASSSLMAMSSTEQMSTIANGTAGQVLTSTGTTSPTFQNPVTSNTQNSTIASGSAVSLTTATPANVTSISLTSGTWLISALVQFGGAPTVSGIQQASISPTSATHGTVGNNSVVSTWQTSNFSAGNCAVTIPMYIVTTGAATFYLVASGNFSGGSMTAYGRLTAVKIA